MVIHTVARSCMLGTEQLGENRDTVDRDERVERAARHMVPGTRWCHLEEGGVLGGVLGGVPPPGSNLTDSSVLLCGILLLDSPEKVRRR